MTWLKENWLLLSTTSILLISLAGVIYKLHSSTREKDELRQQITELRNDLEVEIKKDDVVKAQNINAPKKIEANSPTVADRIHVKELCEKKYAEIDKKLLDLALSPGFENIKKYYETQCAQGMIFDRLSSPYYCQNNTSYVISRDSYMQYCENYYLNQ